LVLKEEQRRQFIEERGKSELEGAREVLKKDKSDFESDVEDAKKMFYGKEREIGIAREDFEGKRNVVKEAFTKRGSEIETEMYGTINEGKHKFEKEREIARSKFKHRASEISGQASMHISGKKSKFGSEREEARKRFLDKSMEISGKQPQDGGKSKLVTKSEEAKSKIEREHISMVEKAKRERERMKKDILQKKGQFLYNVRFARHNIQKHSKDFGEKIAGKREEFETRQEQIVSRHKAHQKAHLIQNLLRTIRTMK
jgi:hypothetical protein